MSERVYRVSLTVDEGWLAWLQDHGAAMRDGDEVFEIRTIVDEDEVDEYCEQDFMAGTLCSLRAGHEGPCHE